MPSKDFLGLHNLVAPIGATKNRKRLGRGESSGHGKTSGRGHKGQKARKSGNVRIGFEGGQNPLARRTPKRGFTNYGFRKDYHPVNLARLNRHFEAGAVVDQAALVVAGLAPNMRCQIKLLGQGTIEHALTLKVHAASESAIAKVREKGGSVEVVA
ncbi:MAG: 50S ribosomal protein L15 [Myxococcaceae bacterium]|nr:50S ribosomal protein L15 [Myxococcaceae bacterium]MBH2006954.1 50S ribosomal protein L15 [Myxococcaceae bacterium]